MAFALKEHQTPKKGAPQTLSREQAREKAFGILNKFFVPNKTETGTTYSLAGRDESGRVLLPIDYARGITDALKVVADYPEVQKEIYDFLSSPEFRTSLEDQNDDHVLGLYAYRRILRSANSLLSDSDYTIAPFDSDFVVTSEFAEIKIVTEDNPHIDNNIKIPPPKLDLNKKNATDYAENTPVNIHGNAGGQKGPGFRDPEESSDNGAHKKVDEHSAEIINFDKVYTETFDIADDISRSSTDRQALDAAMKIVFSAIAIGPQKGAEVSVGMTYGVKDGIEGDSKQQTTERLFLIYSNAYEATRYSGDARAAFFEQLRKIRFEAHVLGQNSEEIYSATQQLAARAIIDYALYAGVSAYSSGFSEVENFIPDVSTMDTKEANDYVVEHSPEVAQLSNLLGNGSSVSKNPQLFSDLINSLCVMLFSNRSDANLAAKTLANLNYGDGEAGNKHKKTATHALLFRAQDDKFDVRVRSACLYYLAYSGNFEDQNETMFKVGNSGMRKFSDILDATKSTARSSFTMSIYMVAQSAYAGYNNSETFENGCFEEYLDALVQNAVDAPALFLRIETTGNGNPKFPIKIGDEITAGSRYLYLLGMLNKLKDYFSDNKTIYDKIVGAIEKINKVSKENKGKY